MKDEELVEHLGKRVSLLLQGAGSYVQGRLERGSSVRGATGRYVLIQYEGNDGEGYVDIPSAASVVSLTVLS